MTAPTIPNAGLAYRVLDHIDAHPELWNQGVYIGKAECGTVACFAGWACLLSGEKPYWSYDGAAETSYVGSSGEFAGGRAEELLRAERYLGFDVDGSREDLFDASNSREDLGRLVAEIFGPRPEEAVVIVDHGPVKPPSGVL